MNRSRRLSVIVVVLGLMSLLGACATSTIGTSAVGADRSQLLLVSSEQLDQIGAEAYAALKTDAVNQGARSPEFLSSHPTDASRIRRIEALLPTVLPLYDRASRP